MLHKSDKLNFLNKNGLVPGCVNKVELGREFTFSYHGATLRTGPGRGLLLVAGGKLCLCVDMMLISKFLEGGEAASAWTLTWAGCSL